MQAAPGGAAFFIGKEDMNTAIILKNVQTHNLRSIDVSIEHGSLTVITGVSGSGKSSLAIDTIYAEGQRRYIESLSPYTRQFLERMERPRVEHISGVLPAICIEAKNVISNARSTVGTQTEVNDFLRILFSRIGVQRCMHCENDIRVDRADIVADTLLSEYHDMYVAVVFDVALVSDSDESLELCFAELSRQGYVRVLCDKGLSDIAVTPVWLQQFRGKSHVAVVADRVKVIKKNRLRLIDSINAAYKRGNARIAAAIFETHDFVVCKAVKNFSDMYGCALCNTQYQLPVPHAFSFNSPIGACPECEGFGRVVVLDRDLIVPNERKSLFEGAIDPWEKPSAAWERSQMLDFCKRMEIPIDVPYKKLTKQHKEFLFNGIEGDGYCSINNFFEYLGRKTYKIHVRVFLSRYRNYVPCHVCDGSRLRKDALAVTIRGRSIYDIQTMSLQEVQTFLDSLTFNEYEMSCIGSVLDELKRRIRYLNEVGLEYLTLHRMSRTLSGGEMQRINLATALGTQLVDTLYVLDEPSIGLHERDNERLMKILKDFKGLGNTVLVIEHDAYFMREADHVIDLGPRAGIHGGAIVAEGTLNVIKKNPDSLTGRYLRGEDSITRAHKMVGGKDQKWLAVHAACAHNLKSIDVRIPLHCFVAITGVSGSGKSSLVYDVVYMNYMKHKGMAVTDVGEVETIRGFQCIDDIVFVGQAPLGKSSRSCPVTYAQAYADIRQLFAGTRDAKLRNLTARDFSFNVKGGRCEVCEGTGYIKEEMHFLADVYFTCEACQGKKFNDVVLQVRWHGKNICNVLAMTVSEAIIFFEECSAIGNKLRLLESVGLGYLTLGQASTTLSMGEAQRMKLAIHMMDTAKQKKLFIFDEPTVGLHYHDIAVLIDAFEALLARGHSICVIEHNMEVIKCADYIIDLGPEGGDQGGMVVCSGTPREVARTKQSYTGAYLKKYLK